MSDAKPAASDLLVCIVATLTTGEWPPRWNRVTPADRQLARDGLSWLASVTPELQNQWFAEQCEAIGAHAVESAVLARAAAQGAGAP